jgi:hypothetical protein
MSEELEQQIRVIVKQQGGGISPHLRAEFQRLCQEDLTTDLTLLAVSVYISIA